MQTDKKKMINSSDEFEVEVSNLKPQKLHIAKCNFQTSFPQLLFSKRTSEPPDNQRCQFNMGKGIRVSDPLKAAEHLMKREYGDTFFYNDLKQEPIFIPPEFVSKIYGKLHLFLITTLSVKFNVRARILTKLQIIGSRKSSKHSLIIMEIVLLRRLMIPGF